MNFSIEFTTVAEETYDILVNQLRERWGDTFVIKLEEKISQCFDKIIVNPYIYPQSEEHAGARRCVLHKNCSMLYSVYNEVIHIEYFWDNRQGPLSTL